jgi:hypothetical protein
MLDEIKKEIGKRDGQEAINTTFNIKCGKNKFVQLVNDMMEYSMNIVDKVGVTLDSDSILLLDEYNKPLSGFEFSKIYLNEYGHISFEHDLELGDDEYKINMI